MTDLILVNAKVTTLDRENPEAQAIAIRDGRFLTVGSEQEVRSALPEAQVIDAHGSGPLLEHPTGAVLPACLCMRRPQDAAGLARKAGPRARVVAHVFQLAAGHLRHVHDRPAPQLAPGQAGGSELAS